MTFSALFQFRDVIDTGEANPILEIVDKDQNIIRWKLEINSEEGSAKNTLDR